MVASLVDQFPRRRTEGAVGLQAEGVVVVVEVVGGDEPRVLPFLAPGVVVRSISVLPHRLVVEIGVDSRVGISIC